MTDGKRKTLDAERSSEPFWRVPWEFAVQAFVGTLIFAIIAAATILLDVLVRTLASYGVSVFVTYGLKTAEYAVFVIDLLLFGVFLWRTAARAARKL